MRPAAEGNRPELLRVALAACALTALVLWRVALTSDLLLRRDMLRVVLPLKAFWAEQVRAGRLPDWYPYDALGQPFAGMMVSGALHPGNLLFLALPAELALKWNALACFPLLASGVWLLLRRLGASPAASGLGAVLAAFNGYTVCITNSLPYLQALATVPWALWAAAHFLERPGAGRAVLAGALLALVLFSGDTQSFLVACALTLPVALLLPGERGVGRRVGAWAAMIVAAALVAAPQLVAAAQVMGDAATAQRPLREALLWSLHPVQLVEVVVGPLFGTGELGRDSSVTDALLGAGTGGLWVESVHFGALGLLLAAAGLASLPSRRLRWLAGGALLAGFLLVLGKYAGLYGILYRVLPLWRPFRYPVKLLPYLFLLLSLAAGLGLDRARASQSVRRRVMRGALALLALVVLLALAEASVHGFTRACQWLAGGALAPELVEAFRANLYRGCALSSLGLAGLWWILRAPAQSPGPWRVPALAAALALFQQGPLVGGVSPAAIEEPPVTIQALRTLTGPPRLGASRVYSAVSRVRAIPLLSGVSFDDVDTAATTTGLEPVTPALYGVEGANVYLPAASARVAALAASPVFAERLMGLFDTGHLAVLAGDYLGRGGNPALVVGRSPRLQMLLVRNPTTLPRASLRRPRCVDSAGQALARVADPRFDVQVDAALECGGLAVDAGEGGAPGGTVAVTAYTPDRVELRAAPSAPSVLVLADAFYSGWSAQVDGSEARILPVNAAGRGVLLAPGIHTVSFSYRTPGLRPALAVSATTLLLGAALGLAGARRRVRARRPPG